MLPEIKVKIDADTAGLTRGLAGATDKLTKFGKVAGAAIGVAAVGAAVGLAALTKRAIDNADALSKASQKMGMTVEALSRLQYAAKLSGVELSGLQTGMNALARNMAANSDAFDQLGVSITNSDGTLRSSVAVLGEVADRFAGMEDGATKTALALSIFGRAGADMIPMLNTGSAGLAAMAQEADNVGATISGTTARAAEKFNDTLTKIEATMSGVVNKVMVAALPALQTLADTLASPEFAEAAGTLATNIINALDAVAKTIATIIDGIKAIGQWMDGDGAKEAAGATLRQLYPEAYGKAEGSLDKGLTGIMMNGLPNYDLYGGMVGSGGGINLLNSADKRTIKPPSGLGGGGGGPTIDAERERIQARLDVIREGFLTENEMLTQKYADDQQLLDDALAKKLLTEKEHKDAV
jgi:hypothetical protein